MISLNLAVTLGLLAVATATPLYMDETPKPCCWPEVWEGNVSVSYSEQTNKINKGSWAPGSTYFDTKNKRIAHSVQVFSPEGNYPLNVVQTESATYVYMRLADLCSKLPPKDITNCLPADFKFQAEARIGGQPGLEMNVFGKEGAQAVVTKNGCAPVTLTFNGESEGKRLFQFFSFYNLRTSITDESVFNIPSYCMDNYAELSPEVLAIVDEVIATTSLNA